MSFPYLTCVIQQCDYYPHECTPHAYVLAITPHSFRSWPRPSLALGHGPATCCTITCYSKSLDIRSSASWMSASAAPTDTSTHVRENNTVYSKGLIDPQIQGAFSVVERAPISTAISSCQPRVCKDELAAILRKEPTCHKYQQRELLAS